MGLYVVWRTQLSGRLHPPDNTPQVINDAIEVTQKLQCRYSWVDHYCIAQDNYDEKHVQIQPIGSEYKNPQATIVVAAGIHSNFGFPGAGFCNS